MWVISEMKWRCRQRNEITAVPPLTLPPHTLPHTGSRIPAYRPVGDSMPVEAYPEAVGDGEDEAGGMMDPPPLELLPGLGHFFDDFFSFIQGNSWASGPAGVAVAGAGACPGGQGCWAARWCVWRPLVAEVLRFCWLLAVGLGWLAVQGLRLGMVCSKGGGITVDSLIDEV